MLGNDGSQMNYTYTVLQATDPDLATKLEEFIAKLQGCLNCTSPFTIVSLLSTSLKYELVIPQSDNSMYMKNYVNPSKQVSQEICAIFIYMFSTSCILVYSLIKCMQYKFMQPALDSHDSHE